jgi:hypothetical protein
MAKVEVALAMDSLVATSAATVAAIESLSEELADEKDPGPWMPDDVTLPD